MMEKKERLPTPTSSQLLFRVKGEKGGRRALRPYFLSTGKKARKTRAGGNNLERTARKGKEKRGERENFVGKSPMQSKGRKGKVFFSPTGLLQGSPAEEVKGEKKKKSPRAIHRIGQNT